MATAVLSYVGSVCWLYEKRRIALLVVVALAAIVGALLINGATNLGPAGIAVESGLPSALPGVLRTLQPITSGLLLGTTMAAMLLGHWYLNAPGMELAAHLRRLLIAMAAAVAVQAALCAA